MSSRTLGDVVAVLLLASAVALPFFGLWREAVPCLLIGAWWAWMALDMRKT